MVEEIVVGVLKPCITQTISFLEWVAEDVEGSLNEMADKIRLSPASSHFKSVSRKLQNGLGRFFVCRDGEAEDIFPAVYASILESLICFEPTFLVFRPTNLLGILSIGDNDSSELKRKFELSGLRLAWTSIHK